ncbi:MAG TPA: UDP-3-O-acyl-N-acetylglucosamine deacetylase [Candidatus Atribacteria bacterium]|nr:UDP-3-O-acyl-N-acetylglucosamine deacetylase [Candidatus Atribacteria bacterium]
MSSVVLQRTLASSCTVEGVGLHSGKPVRVTLFPASENSGIFFRAGETIIPAAIQYVEVTPRCTTLKKGKKQISTVEHFLAACWGSEIDNLEAVVEGEELPGGDGSSIFWFNVFRKVGFQIQSSPRKYLIVKENIKVGENRHYLFAFPDEEFRVWYFLDGGENGHFSQALEFSENDDSDKLLSARTFAFSREVAEILQKGWGKGIREKAFILNEEGESSIPLRFPGEAAGHKILDLMGDLMLTGKRVKGCFIGIRSGHALNREMVKRITEASSEEN